MEKDRKNYQKKYREQYKTRAKRVNLTFDKDEYRAIVRAAKQENIKPTPYIKQLALAGLQQQPTFPQQVQDELKALQFAIRNIGNNINQIAHYRNTVHAMTHADENNLFQHLKQLEEVVQSYTKGRILYSHNSSHDH